MKVLWILLIAQVSTTAQQKTEAQKCCKNKENLLKDNKCWHEKGEKNVQIVLKCEEKYLLDPGLFEEDSFNITANGSLQILESESIISPGDLQSITGFNRFCLVNQHDKHGEAREIAIVCFPGEEEKQVRLSFVLKAVLIFTSVIFLLLTLYVYFRLPELRDTQDKVTMFTLVNLTTFLFFLGVMQIQTPLETTKFCVNMAFVVYFFTMGYFAWLNCVIANVWKTVVLRRWKIQERCWYILNHMYGWIVPITMTIIVAKQHLIKPSLGVNSCWFHHDQDQWSLVYLPISIMLALNVFLCCWTCLRLINIDISPDARKALRYKCILYLKLFLLGGLTWIFEVLSYLYNDHAPSAWLWVIVDSFNCLHGILAFLILIIWRQRIRKELANKQICCIVCPSKWADVDDDEQICLESEGKGKYDLIIKTLK